MIKLDI